MAKMNVLEALRVALTWELEHDPKVVLLGEDVGTAGDDPVAPRVDLQQAGCLGYGLRLNELEGLHPGLTRLPSSIG